VVASRVALLFLFSTFLYLLSFFQVLSVPLVEDKIAQQILPVVSCCFVSIQVNSQLTVICLSSYPVLCSDSNDYGRLVNCHIESYSMQIPWWLLVSFGSYALSCLGWGLFTFRDCPEAYTELLGVSSSLIASFSYLFALPFHVNVCPVVLPCCLNFSFVFPGLCFMFERPVFRDDHLCTCIYSTLPAQFLCYDLLICSIR
jgi:dolichyl-phosphate mannosyltransferase polypeptide 3